MKSKFSFWFSTGVGIGTAIGVIMKNLPAGIVFGIITGTLLALVQTGFEKTKTYSNE